MKLQLLIALCAVAGISASQVKVVDVVPEEHNVSIQGAEKNILLNILISQMFAIIRRVINNGSTIFDIPVLDPLVINHNRFDIPAGLINLDIAITNGLMTGAGGFEINKSVLNLSDMTFEFEIVFPSLIINAEEYDLVGDLFTMIPLYGKGLAYFELQNWKLHGKFFLKQSDDGNSVIIDRIEEPGFELPLIKTKLTGVIGGGDIDNVVNAIIEEVILDYIDRFSGAIARLSGRILPSLMNPTLEKLSTWKYISPFV